MSGRIKTRCDAAPIFYANTVGFLEGKSAIRIYRECLGQKRNFTGLSFWAKGYPVGTVGLDEKTIVQLRAS